MLVFHVFVVIVKLGGGLWRKMPEEAIFASNVFLDPISLSTAFLAIFSQIDNQSQ